MEATRKFAKIIYKQDDLETTSVRNENETINEQGKIVRSYTVKGEPKRIEFTPFTPRKLYKCFQSVQSEHTKLEVGEMGPDCDFGYFKIYEPFLKLGPFATQIGAIL